ncbi:MAG: redoxin domain-containing protein [Planctomycetes bacterium]|nr:redoxin domain-containing protein [Planctomycetota bacterium]
MNCGFLTKTALVVVSLCACLWAAPARALNVGDDAIEIKAKDWFNSEPLSLAALKDKIVVVEFWATWCPPCRKSIPHLIEMYEKYKDKGVVIIGLTNEPKAAIKDFIGQMKMTYAVGAGSDSDDKYGVTGIPHAFIVAPGGKVVWHDHPMAGLDEAIADALKKTPPVMVKPEDKARGEKLVADADALLGQKQFPQALAKLKETQQIKGVFDAKVAAEKKLDELEKQAAVALDEALKKPNQEAYEAVQAFLKTYDGSAVTPKAKTELERLAQTPEIRRAEIETKFAKESAELLAQADSFYKEKNFAKALPLYEKAAKDYPATESGKTAAKKAADMHADKDLMQKVESADAAKMAASLLRMGKSFLANGDPVSAKEKLEQLVKDYPDSAQAAEAKKLLAEIK